MIMSKKIAQCSKILTPDPDMMPEGDRSSVARVCERDGNTRPDLTTLTLDGVGNKHIAT